MRKLKYPIGISDFAEMRNNGYYYIDKTNLIVDLLDKGPVEVTQITRPRRFGKSLGMSTLANFLDIRKDSKQLFEGLAISKNTELCKKWMNQCPVVFFSFKDTDGLTFESAYGMLCMKLAFAFQDYQFLLDDDAISDDDKGIFKRILGRTASMDETKNCFLLLTRMLEIHFKKSAVVILDEYDVPIAKASSNGYYSQMLDVMRAMMSTTLKDNTSLNFAVVTGCLKIAKESIFTGTNNFVSDTILSPRLSESFGFTQADVDQTLCKQAADEIAHLEQELKAIFPAPDPQTVSSDMKEIHDFLSQKFDVHGARLAPELIDRFVEVVTPHCRLLLPLEAEHRLQEVQRGAHRFDGCIGKVHPYLHHRL